MAADLIDWCNVCLTMEMCQRQLKTHSVQVLTLRMQELMKLLLLGVFLRCTQGAKGGARGTVYRSHGSNRQSQANSVPYWEQYGSAQAECELIVHPL